MYLWIKIKNNIKYIRWQPKQKFHYLEQEIWSDLGGAIVVGGIVLIKKHHDDHNLPSLHDNYNSSNPNNKGPNGDPNDTFYTHIIIAKSRKDTLEKTRKSGYGNKPVGYGEHFHMRKICEKKDFKYESTHFTWNNK